MSDSTLAAAVQLSPATSQVDALVFLAAPDTQSLSVQGAQYPDMLLDDGGGTKYYEGAGRDYVVDRDGDGYAVSITTVAGGALDAGGPANASYRKAFWDADDDSEWVASESGQVRVTVDCGAGAATATFSTEGRAEVGGTPYPLGTPAVVANGTSYTRMIQEPNTSLRVVLSAVTGPVKVVAQEHS